MGCGLDRGGFQRARRSLSAPAAGGGRGRARPARPPCTLSQPAGPDRGAGRHPGDQAAGERPQRCPPGGAGRHGAGRRQLADLRHPDRTARQGGGRARPPLRTGAARPVATAAGLQRALREPRRTLPGHLRQGALGAQERARRGLPVADHRPGRARGGTHGRPPPRYRGGDRHLQPQALSVGRGALRHRLALQQRLCAQRDRTARHRRPLLQPDQRAWHRPLHPARGRADAGLHAALHPQRHDDVHASGGPDPGPVPDQQPGPAPADAQRRPAAPPAYPHPDHPARDAQAGARTVRRADAPGPRAGLEGLRLAPGGRAHRWPGGRRGLATAAAGGGALGRGDLLPGGVALQRDPEHLRRATRGVLRLRAPCRATCRHPPLWRGMDGEGG